MCDYRLEMGDYGIIVYEVKIYRVDQKNAPKFNFVILGDWFE